MGVLRKQGSKRWDDCGGVGKPTDLASPGAASAVEMYHLNPDYAALERSTHLPKTWH